MSLRRHAGQFYFCATCVAAFWTSVAGSEVPMGTSSQASASAVWPKGRVEVGLIDATLQSMASAVFDEIERKTFVRFVHVDTGGLTIRSVSPRSAGGSGGSGLGTSGAELCCFEPKGGARTRRRLAIAVVQALGVSFPAGRNTTAKILLAAEGGSGSSGGSSRHAPLIEPLEADAINKFYAAEVLPSTSELPAILEVGIYQLAMNYEAEEWSDMVGGRGRRLMSGAMRFAVDLHSSGQLASLVGALPTFTFHGNKAEVLLLGPESAELMPGSFIPPEASGKGLGVGVRRITQYARKLPGRSLEGGVPTFLDDGSALLLRSAFARTATMLSPQSLESILQEHHSAATLAEVSRWAQSQGAVFGFPSFIPLASKTPRTEDLESEPIEVILMMSRSSASSTQKPQIKSSGSFFMPVLLLVLGTSMGIMATASTSGVPSARTMFATAGALRALLSSMRRLRHRLGGMTAELDLEEIVNSL